MSNKYSWKLGHSRSVPAEVFGKILTETEAKEGFVTPQSIVTAAEPTNSPIHSLFEWDDAKCGIAWRLDQARQLIASIEIIPTENLPPVRGWINIPPSTEEQQAYYHTDIIATDDDKKLRFLAQVNREFHSWKNRLDTYLAMGIEADKDLISALSIVESRLETMLKKPSNKVKKSA
jgi:hypothetical protein